MYDTVCMHACMHACMYVCMYVCMSCMYAGCVPACMYARLDVYVVCRRVAVGPSAWRAGPPKGQPTPLNSTKNQRDGMRWHMTALVRHGLKNILCELLQASGRVTDQTNKFGSKNYAKWIKKLQTVKQYQKKEYLRNRANERHKGYG